MVYDDMPVIRPAHDSHDHEAEYSGSGSDYDWQDMPADTQDSYDFGDFTKVDAWLMKVGPYL